MDNIDISRFPYKMIRKQQKQVLEMIDKNWNDYKYFICELPTGTGKSAIAKTICESVSNSFIITSTKQLQDQYIKEFGRSIVSIKGKANYKCGINNGLNCESGYCVINPKQLKQCICDRICPYYNVRFKALNSQNVITSYQYFLRAVECAGFWKPRNVLIFDECHVLEEQIVQWAEMKLSVPDLTSKYNIIKNCEMPEYIIISSPPTESGYANNKQWLLTVEKLIFNRRNEQFEEIKKALGMNGFVDPDSLSADELESISLTHKSYYELDKIYKKLSVFLKSKDIDDWIIEPIDDGLQITPISIGNLFNQYIDIMAIDKVIFMSASILDLPGYRKDLNLDKDNTLLIKADCNFDPEKSPIIYKPICKMNYKEIDNNLDKITNAVKEILEKHPNEKGIIHTSNYKIASHIINSIQSDRLIMKDESNNNSDIIKKHANSSLPTVLVSPSLTTGADLKDDLSRWQIIVKMPFLNISDKRVKAKMATDNDWYMVQMFKTLIQSCGRSTRSSNDWSTTYIFDEAFKYWFNKHKLKGWFSPQFVKRIKW